MRDGPDGLLDGISIGYTAGVPTTAQARLLAGNVPLTDATTVTRLVEAGTVMLGKLATHEFAFGGHVTNNPWHLEHTTGGSSSGQPLQSLPV